MENTRNSDAIEFKIERHLGVITTHETGWTKEANIVSWNGGVPKVDVREWAPDHDRMTKGITLHEDEAKKLAKIIQAKLN